MVVISSRVLDDMISERTFTFSANVSSAAGVDESQNSHLFVIGGCDKLGKALRTCEMFKLRNTTGNQWSSLPDLPSIKAATNGLVYENEIFTFGGICNGNVQVDTSECLGPLDRDPQWQSLSPLKQPTQGIGLTIRGNKIIGVGGVTLEQTPVDTFFCFDPATRKFANFPRLPTARFSPLVHYSADRDSLYVLGGRIGKTASSASEVFEFRAMRWRTLPANQMQRRIFCAQIVANGMGIFAGGLLENVTQGFSRNVDVFDFQEEAWRSGPQLIKARADAYLGNIGGQLVLCGGFGENRSESGVESLDLRCLARNHCGEDQLAEGWKQQQDLSHPHVTAGHCALDSSLVVFGGLLPTGLSTKVELLECTDL